MLTFMQIAFGASNKPLAKTTSLAVHNHLLFRLLGTLAVSWAFYHVVQALWAEVFLLAMLFLVGYTLYLWVCGIQALVAGVLRRLGGTSSAWLHYRIAVAVVVALILWAVVSLLLQVLPPVITQIQTLIQLLPQWTAQFKTQLNQPDLWQLSASQSVLVDWLTKLEAAGALDRTSQALGGAGVGLLKQLASWGGHTAQGGFYTFIGGVILFYGWLDGTRWRKKLQRHAYCSQWFQSQSAFMRWHRELCDWLGSQLLLGLGCGSALWVLLSMHQLPFSELQALFFMIAASLPVVGTWIGLLPPVLSMVLLGKTSAMITLIALVFFWVLLRRGVLIPRFFPRRHAVSPTWALLWLGCLLQWFGLLGVLLFYPTIAAWVVWLNPLPSGDVLTQKEARPC
jgi:predicted PurR-regulated permease PerM